MTYTEIPKRLPCAGKRKYKARLPRTYHCPHCRQFHPSGRPRQAKEKRLCQRRT